MPVEPTPQFPVQRDPEAPAGANVAPAIPRSPVPNKRPLELSFPDAMREVLNKKRITRLSWESNDTFGELYEGFLQLFIRGEYHQWIVNDGDLNAIDWIVLPQQAQEK